MAKARLILVDDHALFRSALASLIDSQPDLEVAAQADNGQEALCIAEKIWPDLILMDINMAGGDGLQATRLIKERLPAVKICMLTASDDDELLFDAIRAGAQGYLIKHMEPGDFLAEIRRQIRSNPAISEDVAARIVHAAAARPRDTGRDLLSDFTLREIDVLKLVGQGQTNREIAQSLTIAENTVKSHLRSILQKLHYENRVQAATFAIRQGLVEDE